MNRHTLVSHYGHAAALAWARLILGRFRDAVLHDFQPPSGPSAFFNSVIDYFITNFVDM